MFFSVLTFDRVDVFHNLHCIVSCNLLDTGLKRIELTVWRTWYEFQWIQSTTVPTATLAISSTRSGNGLTFVSLPARKLGNRNPLTALDHCIEQLRQAVQCHSDMTPVPLFTIDGKKGLFTHSTTHTCRDFEAVKRWRDERNQVREPFGFNYGDPVDDDKNQWIYGEGAKVYRYQINTSLWGWISGSCTNFDLTNEQRIRIRNCKIEFSHCV
jgi:hypothetical protein